MAKGIVVMWGGAQSSFGFEKVERAKLYGSKRRVAVNADGTNR